MGLDHAVQFVLCIACIDISDFTQALISTLHITTRPGLRILSENLKQQIGDGCIKHKETAQGKKDSETNKVELNHKESEFRHKES